MLSSVIVVVPGQWLLVATQPYRRPRDGHPLWIAGLPTPDSWRSLRQSTYPQLLHHHSGRDPAAPTPRRARAIHARVERWAPDEVPLPTRLVHQILEWLYREDRLCRGTLSIGKRTAAPSRLRLPTLAIVNPRDEIAPPASVLPFIEAMRGPDVRVLEYSGEIGVGLQHLGVLVGQQAYARVWPEIISWLNARR
jgi:pimeloyl-ACP methyl ester carboxylesterase